jgi:hypothetical protein
VVEYAEYNPLDYANLADSCIRALMSRGPFPLPPPQSFEGAGVYALFYGGDLEMYAPLHSADAMDPIYVGKAIPVGRRKGGTGSSSPLYNRLREHGESIFQAENLCLDDFSCRFLVVNQIWISLAETFLIRYYHPIWNVCIDGFGNHDPGGGRYQGEIPWWDVLHPGRPWAGKLRQTRTLEQATRLLSMWCASGRGLPGLD